MTVSVVERRERTTSTPAYVRMALRGLFVAGFAGAVWLLTSSAAHAAPSASDSTEPAANLVADLGGNGVDSIPDGPATTVLTSGTSVVATHVVSPSQATPVVRSASTAAVPDDPARGSLGGVLTVPLVRTDALTRVIPVVRPVTATLGRIVRPLVGTIVRTSGVTAPRLTHLTAAGRAGDGPPTPSATAAAGAHTSTAAAHPAGGTGHRPGAARARTGDTRHPAHGVYQAGVGPRHGPAQPQPAPFQAYPDLGLQDGASTSASASHGGGVAAVEAIAVTGAPVTGSRSVPAEYVEVRGLVAKAPTVSPD